MRILLIHNKYQQPGGEDSVFQSESELLSNNGHTVDSILYDNSSIKTVVDKIVSGIRSFYNPVSSRRLKRKIREFNPDIIHVHNFMPLISPSVFFMANEMNKPIILTLHNYRLICPSATLFYKGEIYERSIHSAFPLDAIWKAVYRNSRIETAIVALITLIHKYLGTWNQKVDGYITLTQFAKQKFSNSAISIPTDKLFIKPNFVEDGGEGEFIRKDYFLFVGRLTEEKGIYTLLRATDLNQFKLVIIGDGPLKKEVEAAANKNSRITYLGFQTKSVVLDYMKKCKALIFPSIWYEGFPVTIAEAFSAGTPVIASDLGSMCEIIHDHKNGLLFQSGNEENLGCCINQVSVNDNLAASLSKGARMSYQEYYTPKINYQQLIGIYRQVIDHKRMVADFTEEDFS